MTVVQRSPTAGIQGGVSLRWVPVYTGTTVGGGAPHTVGGGSAPHIVIPATAGIHVGRGACDGFPSTRERRWAAAHPHRHSRGRQRTHIVIPATVVRRRTPHGRAAAHPHRYSRDGGNPRGEGSLRWVPVYTGTTVGDGAPHTAGGGAPTSSFPATVGGGAPHTVGGGAPTSSFLRLRESTGGSLRWVPVYTGTTVGGGAPHTVGGGGVIPRTVGGGAPTSSFPRRRESTGGGRQRWVPVYTGTTVGRRRTPHGGRRRTPHGRAAAHPTSSFPRRRESTAGGDSDGFPSTRERRRATAHPTRRAAAHPTR